MRARTSMKDGSGASGRLCTRAVCPFGPPCPDSELDRVLALSPQSTTVVCLVDRTIVWANPSASQIGDLLGRSVAELVVGSDQPAIEALLTEALAGRDGFRASVTALCADHELRPVDIVSALNGRDPRQCIVYISPCSEQRRLSQERAQMASLVSAMEAIAREIDRCGFGVTPPVSAVKNLDGIDRLTERERTVIEMVARGLRTQAIADSLFVSASTVRNHLSSIYQKLGFPNQAALLEFLLDRPASRARPQGEVDLEEN